jgi:hypothetical protein
MIAKTRNRLRLASRPLRSRAEAASFLRLSVTHVKRKSLATQSVSGPSDITSENTIRLKMACWLAPQEAVPWRGAVPRSQLALKTNKIAHSAVPCPIPGQERVEFRFTRV